MILETMPAVRDLPAEKKLLLIEELWEDMGISVDEQKWHVREDHLDLAEAALSGGGPVVSWDNLKARLNRKGK